MLFCLGWRSFSIFFVCIDTVRSLPISFDLGRYCSVLVGIVPFCRYSLILVGVVRSWSVLFRLCRYRLILVGIVRSWSVLFGLCWYRLILIGTVRSSL